MPTLRTEYVQDGWRDTPEYEKVQAVSDSLLDHLNTPGARQLMARANLPGISSSEVQATFLPFAQELGFVSEAKGLFKEYDNKFLRPDYYLSLGDTGILMEVERGKTTTNNMDLLDLWKTHVCTQAHYLFLMVPQALKHNDTMSPKKEFASVSKRLGSFYAVANYTNVRAVHIFGY